MQKSFGETNKLLFSDLTKLYLDHLNNFFSQSVEQFWNQSTISKGQILAKEMNLVNHKMGCGSGTTFSKNFPRGFCIWIEYSIHNLKVRWAGKMPMKECFHKCLYDFKSCVPPVCSQGFCFQFMAGEAFLILLRLKLHCMHMALIFDVCEDTGH